MDLTNLNKDRKPRRKSAVDLSTMVYGKIPPQAKDLEEAILGICMMENRFDVVIQVLKPECFYVNAHQHIFQAFINIDQRHENIEILSVMEELRKQELLEIVGGPYFLTVLTNKVISSANVESYARIVYQKFLARETIRICGEKIGAAYEDSTDAFDLLDEVQRDFNNLSINKQTKPYFSFQTILDKSVQRIYTTKHSGEELTGVPTGITFLDQITQGWQSSDLIVIAARPAVGKSAVAANFAFNAATHETKPVAAGVFTLEMSAGQYVDRLISAASEIPLYDLKRGRVTDEQLNKLSDLAYKDHVKTMIFFDDTPGMEILQLKAKARMMVSADKVGLIIIDYLQLMKGSRDRDRSVTREQEVATISRELKHLAKELNVPIIALSQLSRDGEGADPKLTNIRESGAIEQDADAVFFLIEPSEDDIRKDASLKDSILLKVAKHRNGTKERVPIKFVRSIQKLMSESDYDHYMNNAGKGQWKPIPPSNPEPELPF